mmetsp:Transcript_30900/g.64815  ORF Transcript_30900/g.64815 Transcript_30900/m.64815 type:complete len:234 (-) Transcript_30900:28-729(-)
MRYRKVALPQTDLHSMSIGATQCPSNLHHPCSSKILLQAFLCLRARHAVGVARIVDIELLLVEGCALRIILQKGRLTRVPHLSEFLDVVLSVVANELGKLMQLPRLRIVSRLPDSYLAPFMLLILHHASILLAVHCEVEENSLVRLSPCEAPRRRIRMLPNTTGNEPRLPKSERISAANICAISRSQGGYVLGIDSAIAFLVPKVSMLNRMQEARPKLFTRAHSQDAPSNGSP